MKRTKAQKVLAAVLSLTMILGTGIMANAATSTKKTTASKSATTVASESTTTSVVTTTPTTSSVAGVKSTVAGAYSAKSVNGIAVTTPLADLTKALGLTGNQKPYLIAMDTDKTKSTAAMASLEGACEAINGTMGPVINLNLGVRDGVVFRTLTDSDATVEMVIGIPKDFQEAGAKYAVIGVRYGGELTLYENKTDSTSTVTFDMEAGLGTYAIVKY